MSAFTSTSLTSLIAAAIGAIDPELSGAGPRPDPMQGAVSPVEIKRGMLAALAERHGAAAALRIGQHLSLAEESPIQSVLTRASDPAILAAKWMRLESYLHSSHRTRITPAGPRRWTCHRDSTGAPPLPVENYLIAGVLVGLLGEIGACGCRLRIAGRDYTAGDFATLVSDDPCRTFEITWDVDRAASAERPLPGSGAINDRLADLLAQDLGRCWKLTEAARALACSDRSLQRHLSATGRSFTSVLRRARMRKASALLSRGDTSLAEVGYCCGYADQAHFQRDFRRVTNMTPATFRELAASSDALVQ